MLLLFVIRKEKDLKKSTKKGEKGKKSLDNGEII